MGIRQLTEISAAKRDDKDQLSDNFVGLFDNVAFLDDS